MLIKLGAAARAVFAWFGLGWMPVKLRFTTYALAGAAAGLALSFAFIIDAYGFIGDDPDICASCHVMRPEHVTWARGSHAREATCNDCHVPHTNLAQKYAYKQKSGTWDLAVFLGRREPEVICIKEDSIEIIRENCLRCHDRQIQALAAHGQSDRFCAECHRETAHGRVHSLASTPHARYPAAVDSGKRIENNRD